MRFRARQYFACIATVCQMAIAPDLKNAHERDLQLAFVVEKHGVGLGGGNVLEDVPRLAFEHFAQHIERAETDRPDFAGFDAREIHIGDPHFVSKIVQRDMPICHNLVEMKNDWHRAHLDRVVGEFLQKDTVFEYKRESEDDACGDKGSKVYCNDCIITRCRISRVPLINLHKGGT